MKEYSFNFDVHIFDTDCYGVFWHGAYAKWLEMGRVNLFKEIGLSLKEMSDHHDIIFPVVEQNIKFKRPARHTDVLRLTTRVEAEPPKFIFHQTVTNLENEKLLIEARTDVVMVNGEGRMYRHFPDIIEEKIKVLR